MFILKRISLLLAFSLALQVLTLFSLAQSVGSVAPNFTLLDRHKQALHLYDYLGTPIVLNFWATWCPPCRAELPIFQEISDELNANGQPVTFIIVNGGEDFDFANLYLEEANIFRLVAAFDGSRQMRAAASSDDIYVERSIDVLRRYLVRGMPTTFFIDAQGFIRHRSYGGLNRLIIQTGMQSLGLHLPLH